MTNRKENQDLPIRDKCDKVEFNYTFRKPLTEEELSQAKEELIDLAGKLDALVKEKKTILTEIKSRIDPVKDQFNKTLEDVQTKKKTVTEEVYIFFNRKQRLAEIFDADGSQIGTRELTLDELQMTINYNDK